MLDLLNKMKSDFYEVERKPLFFKNAQKFKCADQITQQIPLEELLKSTVYCLSTPNLVYIDYPLFKLFANTDNSTEIVNYIINILVSCINEYGQYEIHINLKGFTISAAERYRPGIQHFCNQCCRIASHKDVSVIDPNIVTPFTSKLNKMYIYHTPSVMEHITRMFSPFMNPTTIHKMIFYPKNTSEQLLEELLSTKVSSSLQNEMSV